MALRLLLLMAISWAANAQVYRWVDENGQVHFSSQPPQEELERAESYQLNVPRPSSSNRQSASSEPTQNGNNQESIAPVTTTQPKASVSAEQADKNCQEAKKYIQVLNGNASRRFQQEDGSFRPMTDEERNAQLSKANQVVEKYCN